MSSQKVQQRFEDFKSRKPVDTSRTPIGNENNDDRSVWGKFVKRTGKHVLICAQSSMAKRSGPDPKKKPHTNGKAKQAND